MLIYVFLSMAAGLGVGVGAIKFLSVVKAEDRSKKILCDQFISAETLVLKF